MQLLRHAETQAGLHVNCPSLLADFNQNRKVSTNLSKAVLAFFHDRQMEQI